MTKTYGPYAPVAQAAGLVFTAGQVGAVDGMASPDITAQIRTALQNLAAVLESAGCTLSAVAKTTVYLTNADDFETMNRVYAETFQRHGAQPARTTVIVADLPHIANNPLLFEIEAVAKKEPR